MSYSSRLLVFCFLSFISCNTNSSTVGTISTTLQIQEEKGKKMTADLPLVAYPESLLKDYGLDEWEEFRNLYETMERLKSLDLRDVEVNILGLSSRLKDLISKPLPGAFETPQIRSRLKVVQMQTQKSRYFTRHYKEDSLAPSLEALYAHYNALLNRMAVLKEEANTVESETAQN